MSIVDICSERGCICEVCECGHRRCAHASYAPSGATLYCCELACACSRFSIGDENEAEDGDDGND